MSESRIARELRILRHQLAGVASHHHPILGTSWSSLGALLIVVGALLLILDAASGPKRIGSVTFGGTLPDPKGRVVAGIELVGSISVLGGSTILAVVSGISLLAVVAVMAAVAVATFVSMAFFLRRHMALILKEGNVPPGSSWWWCIRHPRWVPDRDSA